MTLSKAFSVPAETNRNFSLGQPATRMSGDFFKATVKLHVCRGTLSLEFIEQP
jgi:hypothetical protein